ncbi:MAG: hypothetical protein MK137_04095 [Rickettsiales bacterium]|nr:hypothetical protein [Rickettsiales bacterium]
MKRKTTTTPSNPSESPNKVSKNKGTFTPKGKSTVYDAANPTEKAHHGHTPPKDSKLLPRSEKISPRKLSEKIEASQASQASPKVSSPPRLGFRNSLRKKGNTADISLPFI